jgi:hypothetical protein
VRATALALAVGLSACVPDADPRLAFDLTIPVLLTDGRVTHVSRMWLPDAAAASPESLRHYMEATYWPAGTRAEISRRTNISDGFVATFVRSTMRETHVVRQVGSRWWRCTAHPVADAEMEALVVAYCQAHPLQF